MKKALLDACVLFPAQIRDLFMHLAVEELFFPRWSNQIHNEWISAVLRERPELSRDKLERTKTLMNRYALGCLVEDFEHLIPGISLPDPNDAHVLAAAIHSSCEIIVTFNLKDFPDSSLQPYGIVCQHPDNFLVDLYREFPTAFVNAVSRQRQFLKNPRFGQNEFLDNLGVVGLVELAAALKTSTI